MQKKMWSLHFYTLSVKFQTQPDSNLEIKSCGYLKKNKVGAGQTGSPTPKKKKEIELYPYTMLKTSLKMDQTAKCKR